jgi:hypothetical protein
MDERGSAPAVRSKSPCAFDHLPRQRLRRRYHFRSLDGDRFNFQVVQENGAIRTACGKQIDEEAIRCDRIVPDGDDLHMDKIALVPMGAPRTQIGWRRDIPKMCNIFNEPHALGCRASGYSPMNSPWIHEKLPRRTYRTVDVS